MKKRVLVSADFIHWLNSFRKQDVFVRKFQRNKNPAATELISLFSSDAPEAFALVLPNNTDLIVIKLLVDNSCTKSVEMYSSLPGCPGWASALVDAVAASVKAEKRAQSELAAAAAALDTSKKRVQEAFAAIPQEMLQLFQATYNELSAQNKQDYAEWVSWHKLEAGDIASCIFLAHWACEYDVEACLEMLKAGGANFDIPDKKGYTPAHYAAENGFDECLEILTAGGANFNIQDNDGKTPVHCVPREGIESLKILKDGGADFNIKDRSGQTLVHYAAAFCSEEFLGQLKACGANFDIQDKWGNAPAHIAAKNGYSGCLKILDGFGANFNLQNYYGSTPAHLAAEGCHTAGPRMVCVYDVPDSNGYTQQHWVLAKSYTECLGKLKIVGANHEGCLQVLKARGVNFDIQDNNGQTAREIASKKGIKIDDF